MGRGGWTTAMLGVLGLFSGAHGCSSDIFHSTDWKTACDGGGRPCGEGSAGGGAEPSASSGQSSSASSGGGSAGGGAQGASSGASSSSSSSAGSSSSSGPPPPSCDESSADCVACGECSVGASGTCADEKAKCDPGTDCDELLQCGEGCTTSCAGDQACKDACDQGCRDQHPQGSADFLAALKCVYCTDCPTLCAEYAAYCAM